MPAINTRITRGRRATRGAGAWRRSRGRRLDQVRAFVATRSNPVHHVEGNFASTGILVVVYACEDLRIAVSEWTPRSGSENVRRSILALWAYAHRRTFPTLRPVHDGVCPYGNTRVTCTSTDTLRCVARVTRARETSVTHESYDCVSVREVGREEEREREDRQHLCSSACAAALEGVSARTCQRV